MRDARLRLPGRPKGRTAKAGVSAMRTMRLHGCAALKRKERSDHV